MADNTIVRHLTLVVVVLLGVFIYAGWRIKVSRSDKPAPEVEPVRAELATVATAREELPGLPPVYGGESAVSADRKPSTAIGGVGDSALFDDIDDIPPPVLSRDNGVTGQTLGGKETEVISVPPQATELLASAESYSENTATVKTDIGTRREEPEEKSPASAVGVAVYTVRSGDTLSTIARQLLGSSSRSTDIYNANRDVLSNPNRLKVGMELRVPGAAKVVHGTARDSSSGGSIAHRVEVGETLYSVAARYYGDTSRRTIDLLKAVNPQVVDGKLRAGTRLVIPDESVLRSVEQTAKAEPRSEKKYVIRSGDTLSAISRRIYGTGSHWKEIHQANVRKIPNPNKLPVGVEIVIPTTGE